VVGQRVADRESNGHIQLPSLAIAYGVGGLSKDFNQGDWVIDKTYRVAAKGEPIEIIVASEVVYWKEYLTKQQKDADPTRKAKNYPTKAAAKEAGEIVDWPPRGSDLPKPTVSRAGVLQLLVKKPDKIECALFCFEVAGSLYAPCRAFFDKGAFKNIDAEIERASGFTNCATRKGGLATLRFTWTTTVTPKPNGTTICLPVARHVGGNSEADALKIVQAFTGAGPMPEESDAGEEG